MSISSDNQILYRKTNWMCVNDQPTNLGDMLRKRLEENKSGPCPVTTTLPDDASLLMGKLPLNPSVPAMQALAAQGVPMELLDSGQITIFPTLTAVSSRQVNALFTVSLIVSYPGEGKRKTRTGGIRL